MPVTIDDIRRAADEIRGDIVETPTTFSRMLSERTGAHVLLKFESLQFTASFKDRGALVKMQSLDPEQRRQGVIAMSAGNHAQAVAYRAQRLGIKAVIVMPRFTPTVKVERTRRFGAEVIIEGDGLDDAGLHAQQLASERGLHLVHPYDDERIITGQGTVALEILAEDPKLDAIAVPVGGGGLIAGIAIAAKALRPDVEIVGVEASRFPSMRQALDGVPITCGASSMAEGIAVKVPGRLTLPIVKELVDDVLLVDEDDIEEAVLLLLEAEKAVVEGAGAAGVAALLRHRVRFAGRRVGVILSGGNIDLMILSSVIQRGLVRTGRIVRLLVEIRDVPGVLAEVTRILGGADANILEARHQRAFTTMGPRSVEVEFVLQTRGIDHIQEIVDALRQAGHTPRIPPGEGPISKARPEPSIGLGS